MTAAPAITQPYGDRVLSTPWQANSQAAMYEAFMEEALMADLPFGADDPSPYASPTEPRRYRLAAPRPRPPLPRGHDRQQGAWMDLMRMSMPPSLMFASRQRRPHGMESIHEALAGAARAGLPPHILFSDRDFTADDYEMLCKLDDSVESRKAAPQQVGW